jgi:TetR/AcrR family transcriptional regulator, repressor for uid operon
MVAPDLLARFHAAGTPDGDPYTSRILRAAVEQFVDVGIRRSTMSDVARRAGLSRVTVYRRFAGRADLVEAVILAELRWFLADYNAAVAGLPTAAERLVEGFVALVRAIRTHPLLGRLLGTDPDVLLPAVTVHFGPYLALAGQVLAEQTVSDGVPLPAGVDAGAVAELCIRTAMSHLLTRDSCSPVDTDEAARAYAVRYLAPIVTGGAGGRTRRWSVRRTAGQR